MRSGAVERAPPAAWTVDSVTRHRNSLPVRRGCRLACFPPVAFPGLELVSGRLVRVERRIAPARVRRHRAGGDRGAWDLGSIPARIACCRGGDCCLRLNKAQIACSRCLSSNLARFMSCTGLTWAQAVSRLRRSWFRCCVVTETVPRLPSRYIRNSQSRHRLSSVSAETVVTVRCLRQPDAAVTPGATRGDIVVVSDDGSVRVNRRWHLLTRYRLPQCPSQVQWHRPWYASGWCGPGRVRTVHSLVSEDRTVRLQRFQHLGERGL
jgi:hypothetical protein